MLGHGRGAAPPRTPVRTAGFERSPPRPPMADDAPDAPLDTTAALGGRRSWRDRLTRRGEFILAAFPVATILVVVGTVEAFSRNHVLFSSLAGSAFLIYLDPEHPSNRVRTLAIAHGTAAVVGISAHAAFGPTFPALAVALVATIGVLVAVDHVHPPAAGTALAFAYRNELDGALGLFALAVAMVAVLVVVEVVVIRVFRRLASSSRFGVRHAGKPPGPDGPAPPA